MRALLVMIFLTMASAVWSVQPDEILADQALEARARAISLLIRCPVCQGETIDDSNATIAKDLRLVVRDRLKAGDSDDQVIDYLVNRYGEFILFKPRATGANLVLWVAGPAALLLGLIGAASYIRRRRSLSDSEDRPLTADEETRLNDILGN